MFEKILICLDGSKAAEKTLVLIPHEAVHFRSKLVLLRVVSLPEVLVPVNIPGSPALPLRTRGAIKRTTEEQDEATRYLEEKAVPLKDKGLKVEIVVLPGAVGETILNYAEANGCTLIVIGAHGHGGFRRFTLGSTADYVVHRSTVPVLTIK